MAVSFYGSDIALKHQQGDKKEMDTYLGSSLQHPLCDLCFAADTNSLVVADFGHKLILGPSFCVVVNPESTLPERLDSLCADIFEQQELDLIHSEGFQSFRTRGTDVALELKVAVQWRHCYRRRRGACRSVMRVLTGSCILDRYCARHWMMKGERWTASSFSGMASFKRQLSERSLFKTESIILNSRDPIYGPEQLLLCTLVIVPDGLHGQPRV